MKRITVLFAALVLLFSFSLSAQAEAKPISVWFEGKQLTLGTEPPIVDRGTTYVPAEPLLKALGFSYSWDAQTNTATGTDDEFSLTLTTDKMHIVVDGYASELVAKPRFVGNTLYAPLRVVSEFAGYKVAWNGELKQITIEAVTPSRGFLWKTEHGGNTVYLLGSIHIANEAMYPLSQAIDDGFKQADYLVVEADVTKATTPEAQQKVMELSTYSDGTTLKDHIDPELYADLNEILVKNGMQAGALDAFKPWSVASTLEYLKAMTAGYEAGIGIDMYFLQQAIAGNLPILELESIDFQLNMMNGFSPDLQETLLWTSVYGFNDENWNALEEMSTIWTEGDEEELLELTESFYFDEEYAKAMLTDRNVAMADKIDGYLQDKDGKTYFVVVGAGHMLGGEGIVPLLEKKGYTVVRQ